MLGSGGGGDEYCLGTTLSINDVAVQRWQARFVVEVASRNFLPSMDIPVIHKRS